jgi:hypothetical protein
MRARHRPCHAIASSIAAAILVSSAVAYADDVVVLNDGRRIQCTVLVDQPDRPLLIRLADGRKKHVRRSAIQEIDYESGHPPPPPPPPPAAASAGGAPGEASTESADESSAPPATSHFLQIAVRTGAQFPFGNATGAANDSMSNSFGWQVPIILDVGWKFTPALFVGLYGGAGFGGTSGQVSTACSQNNESCFGATLRGGIEAVYYFAPSASLDPWLGYGIGYESSSVNIGASNGNGGSIAVSGWEFAHFMAGLDFRLGKVVGLGPTIDFSIGQYGNESISTGTQQGGSYVQTGSGGGSIPQTAIHEWLLVGGRVVFFP